MNNLSYAHHLHPYPYLTPSPQHRLDLRKWRSFVLSFYCECKSADPCSDRATHNAASVTRMRPGSLACHHGSPSFVSSSVSPSPDFARDPPYYWAASSWGKPGGRGRGEGSGIRGATECQCQCWNVSVAKAKMRIKKSAAEERGRVQGLRSRQWLKPPGVGTS